MSCQAALYQGRAGQRWYLLDLYGVYWAYDTPPGERRTHGQAKGRPPGGGRGGSEDLSLCGADARRNTVWGRVTIIQGPVPYSGISDAGGKESFQGGYEFLEQTQTDPFQGHFQNIHRNYADTMLGWLERETDFFTAPAPLHEACQGTGGLLVHSLNVYYRLRDIAIRDMAGKEDPGEHRLSEEQEETVAVIALLHDVCARWAVHDQANGNRGEEPMGKYEGYTYKDPLPPLVPTSGHGKPIADQRHMDLCPEALAIRWHMGAYDIHRRRQEHGRGHGSLPRV